MGGPGVGQGHATIAYTLAAPAALLPPAFTAPIDRTSPLVTITTPADGATYAESAVVRAGFSCADEQGGSGVATCSGTVADGSAVDTSTGSHTFTVTAADNAGNAQSRTVSYTVSEAASASVSASVSATEVSGLRPAHRCVTVAGLAQGTQHLSFGFGLSAAAAVRFEILRRVDSPRHRACPRPGGTAAITFATVATGLDQPFTSERGAVAAVRSGALDRTPRAGHHRLTLPRTLGGHRLRWGSYLLRLTPEAGGVASGPVADVQFWILRTAH